MGATPVLALERGWRVFRQKKVIPPKLLQLPYYILYVLIVSYT